MLSIIHGILFSNRSSLTTLCSVPTFASVPSNLMYLSEADVIYFSGSFAKSNTPAFLIFKLTSLFYSQMSLYK